MFGLFKSSFSANQLAGGLVREVLPEVQSALQKICTEADIATGENYQSEESALVFYMGMHAILSRQWKPVIQRKVTVAYMECFFSSNNLDDSSEFYDQRMDEYTERLSEEKGKLPMNGVVNHFLDSLGVEANDQHALRLGLNFLLLKQITALAEWLNYVNSKFKIE